MMDAFEIELHAMGQEVMIVDGSTMVVDRLEIRGGILTVGGENRQRQWKLLSVVPPPPEPERRHGRRVRVLA